MDKERVAKELVGLAKSLTGKVRVGTDVDINKSQKELKKKFEKIDVLAKSLTGFDLEGLERTVNDLDSYNNYSRNSKNLRTIVNQVVDIQEQISEISEYLKDMESEAQRTEAEYFRKNFNKFD